MEEIRIQRPQDSLNLLNEEGLLLKAASCEEIYLTENG